MAHGNYLNGGQGPGTMPVDDGTCGTDFIRMTGVGVDTNLVTFVGTNSRTTEVRTRIYELDENAVATFTAGNVRVNISAGATAAQTVTALVAAINADPDRICEAVDLGGDVVGLNAILPEWAITATESLANGVLGAAAFYDAAAGASGSFSARSHTVLASEIDSWAVAATEVPIGTCNTTAQPSLFSLTVLRVFGAMIVIVPTNTLSFRFVQAATNRWQLVCRDPGVVLTAGDVINWVSVSAAE